MSRPLGRGLSALLGEMGIETNPSMPLTSINILHQNIHPNPKQPRRFFDDEALQALADSIQEKGILQPILVRPSASEEGNYDIIAGERRWRAASIANVYQIPAIIIPCTDEEALAIGLIENLQRENLNPLEEAESLQRLSENFKKTQDQVARMIGKSRTYVTNMIRLLNLPEEVKTSIYQGELSQGHARAILKSEHPEILARQIIEENLSVRQVESLVRSQKTITQTEDVVAYTSTTNITKNQDIKYQDIKQTQAVSLRPPSPFEEDQKMIANRMTQALELPVEIRIGAKGAGKVIITFEDFAQLDRLVYKLNGEEV